MRRTFAIVVALSAISLAGAGCSWVKTTPGGAQVVEATAADVSGCQELGTASGTTRTSVGLPRDKDVIRDEQVTLARNQAALIGGDTIVQAGPPQGGMLSFTVYRCH
jgi:hypothetical protein